MDVAFVTGRLNYEASGVTRIMCDLANALSVHGACVTTYAALHAGGPKPPVHLLKPPGRFIAERGYWLGGLSMSPKLRNVLFDAVRNVDIVHAHSMWMLPTHYAASAARRFKKPVMLTAHGALEPWAIARSRWKKRPVAWWWQDRDLRDAACIQVNTPAEISGVRAYGLANPIAVLPNGVDLAPFDSTPEGGGFLEYYPELRGKRIVLFMSRLHEKKGLSHLIDAWQPVSRDHRDWHLVLAGPDDGFEQDARQRVGDLGLSKSITFTGALQGARKLQAFAAAEAFALPSFSEGFSMAILEAMAASLPVLLTPGCNFEEVSKCGAGIEVDPNAKDTERGLRNLIEMSNAQREDMGRRGRNLIEQSYSWDAIARQFLSLYRWLISGGSAPSFVRFSEGAK